MKVVVDIQFFRTSDKVLTPKELAIFDGVRAAHYIFKPPFPFHDLSPKLRQQAEWIMENHHAIPWGEGQVPAYLFKPILLRLLNNVEAIYVKGREKADFVRKQTGNSVIELDEEPAVGKMEPSCFYHSTSKCVCALTNVYFLYSNYVME